jgi:hypothetical protein
MNRFTVIKKVNVLIPDIPTENTQSLFLSRKFLVAYLLCQINSWSYPYSSMAWCLEGYACLDKGVSKFLEKSLEILFEWPNKMKEGFFYLVFNKKTKKMVYKVRYHGKSYQGEIMDEQYKWLRNKLSRRGTLSLREVNFLIETVVAPRQHLPYFCEVHDPLSLDYFCDFLESDRKTKKEALQLLSHLKPFDEFGCEPPTALALDALDDFKKNNREEIDEIILRYRLK